MELWKIMQSLEGKIALVTGAASGIGLATSELLQELGAKVIRVDKSYGNSSKDPGSDSTFFQADLRNPKEVQNLIAEVERKFLRLHIVVNSAGVEMKGSVIDVSVEDYELVMDTNVKSIFLVCKYAIPLMLKSSEGGSIINLSSDLGIQPIPGVDTYAASKGAIIALTKAMSKNWAKRGLRVNCVAPGPIDTPLLRRFQDPKSLEFVREVMLPQGRLGSPREVANVIAFIASDDSSLVNGAVVTANGGLVG